MKKQDDTLGIVMKWVTFFAFGFMLLGGLSWLVIGLFGLNLFGLGIVMRVIYSLFGIGALWLLGVVVYRVVRNEEKKTTPAKRPAQ